MILLLYNDAKYQSYEVIKEYSNFKHAIEDLSLTDLEIDNYKKNHYTMIIDLSKTNSTQYIINTDVKDELNDNVRASIRDYQIKKILTKN